MRLLDEKHRKTFTKDAAQASILLSDVRNGAQSKAFRNEVRKRAAKMSQVHCAFVVVGLFEKSCHSGIDVENAE